MRTDCVVLTPASRACLPKLSIQVLSWHSCPDTMSYLGRFLKSSYRSFTDLSILIFFMQPSSGLRSTLLAGTKRRVCVLKCLMELLLTGPFDFHVSATATTFSGSPLEKREPLRLIVGEPTSIYSLVPMPSASSIQDNKEFIIDHQDLKGDLHFCLRRFMLSFSFVAFIFCCLSLVKNTCGYSESASSTPTIP